MKDPDGNWDIGGGGKLGEVHRPNLGWVGLEKGEEALPGDSVSSRCTLFGDGDGMT